MILSYLGLMDTKRTTIEARITTEHSASSYGMPVIVLPDGGGLDYTSAILLNYRVEQASAEEEEMLAIWRRNMPPIDPIVTASSMGRKGGSAKSVAKAKAARANGRKGGRPKKE